jgi:hypothetical protein
MGILKKIKQDAKETYERYKSHLPEVPKIPLVEAIMVPAKSLFPVQDVEVGGEKTITSKAIYLQTGSKEVHSFAVDLSGLHARIIFSVVLCNSTDLVGKKPATILVRNGVTATAARKLAGQEMKWFYHGKPMNDGDMRLHVSIGRDQMTFVYYENGRLYVHGDCPVSRLGVDDIGDVAGMPFYVHIYTREKVSTRTGHQSAVTIRVLDISAKGYIHESVGEDERNDFGFELIEPSEAVLESDPEPIAQDDGLPSKLAGMLLTYSASFVG